MRGYWKPRRRLAAAAAVAEDTGCSTGEAEACTAAVAEGKLQLADNEGMAGMAGTGRLRVVVAVLEEEEEAEVEALGVVRHKLVVVAAVACLRGRLAPATPAAAGCQRR